MGPVLPTAARGWGFREAHEGAGAPLIRLRHLFLAVLFLVRPAPAAEAEPAVLKVLDGVRARFRAADAVQVEAVAGMKGGVRRFLRTTWARPGLLREECWDGETPRGEPQSVRISDGKISWHYFAAQKHYYEREVPPGAADREPFLLGFTPDGILAWTLIEPGREAELSFGGGCLAMPVKGGGVLALGPESEVDGKPCHVLTYTTGATVQTYAIAKADFTPLRYSLDSSSEHRGKTFNIHAVSELKRLDTAPGADPARFRFTPPEGAVKAVMQGEDRLLPVGAEAPGFTMVDRDGREVSLADFAGKVVLLNFWFYG